MWYWQPLRSSHLGNKSFSEGCDYNYSLTIGSGLGLVVGLGLASFPLLKLNTSQNTKEHKATFHTEVWNANSVLQITSNTNQVLFWTVRHGPSCVQHCSHSVCTEMRRLDTHQGDSAKSILNETGISEYSPYWFENTTLSFLKRIYSTAKWPR